jgi:hypothetical protein
VTLALEAPDEDSEDLLDEEIARAIPTTDATDLGKKLHDYLLEHPGEQVSGYELRRRKPHLYWRAQVVHPEHPTESVIFTADWLQRGT